MSAPDCIFCKIIVREIPAHIVYENDETLAFLDINPINPGHTLVIPKVHAPDVFEINEVAWHAVMATVRTIAHALEATLAPTGINLAMNNRAPAGQSVFHAHVHVIPRYPDDGHELWKGRSYADGEAVVIADKIRATM